jgi:hypothetical protein
VSQVAPPVKHNFGIEFVSPLFRLQLEPASPSYTGIGKVACIWKWVLQDCQMETLKLVSKARVTRRGYLGVGYRFLQVDTIRNRIHCPLIDHALSACVRKVLIDLLAQHISLVGFFLAKIRLWLLSMWTANVRLCSQQSQTSVANSDPFLKALFLMQSDLCSVFILCLVRNNL